MTDKEFLSALARNMYWGYIKDTTGTPGKWSELPQEQRKIWRKMANRALLKIAALSAAREGEMPK